MRGEFNNFRVKPESQPNEQTPRRAFGITGFEEARHFLQ